MDLRHTRTYGKKATRLCPCGFLGDPERGCGYTCERADRAFLVAALEKMRLSARATDRVLRVARTVADLAAEPRVERGALLEALGLRALDRRAG